MNRKIIAHMDEAVAEVFAVMLEFPTTTSRVIPTRFTAPPSLFKMPYLSARIQFMGTLDGACTIQLNQHTAAEFTSAMTGIPLEEVSATLAADIVGELCNLLAGSWKMRQPPEEAAYTLSCPAIKTVVADCFHYPTHRFRETVTLLYTIANHPITVNLAFT